MNDSRNLIFCGQIFQNIFFFFLLRNSLSKVTNICLKYDSNETCPSNFAAIIDPAQLFDLFHQTSGKFNIYVTPGNNKQYRINISEIQGYKYTFYGTPRSELFIDIDNTQININSKIIIRGIIVNINASSSKIKLNFDYLMLKSIKLNNMNNANLKLTIQTFLTDFDSLHKFNSISALNVTIYGSPTKNFTSSIKPLSWTSFCINFYNPLENTKIRYENEAIVVKYHNNTFTQPLSVDGHIFYSSSRIFASIQNNKIRVWQNLHSLTSLAIFGGNNVTIIIKSIGNPPKYRQNNLLYGSLPNQTCNYEIYQNSYTPSIYCHQNSIMNINLKISQIINFKTVFLTHSSQININSSLYSSVDIRRIMFYQGNETFKSDVPVLVHFLEQSHHFDDVSRLIGSCIYNITHIYCPGIIFIEKFDFASLFSVSIPFYQVYNGIQYIEIKNYYNLLASNINFYFIEDKLYEESFYTKKFMIFKGVYLDQQNIKTHINFQNSRFKIKTSFKQVDIKGVDSTQLVVESIFNYDGWSSFYNITSENNNIELTDSGNVCVFSSKQTRSITIAMSINVTFMFLHNIDAKLYSNDQFPAYIDKITIYNSSLVSLDKVSLVSYAERDVFSSYINFRITYSFLVIDNNIHGINIENNEILYKKYSLIEDSFDTSSNLCIIPTTSDFEIRNKDSSKCRNFVLSLRSSSTFIRILGDFIQGCNIDIMANKKYPNLYIQTDTTNLPISIHQYFENIYIFTKNREMSINNIIVSNEANVVVCKSVKEFSFNISRAIGYFGESSINFDCNNGLILNKRNKNNIVTVKMNKIPI